MRCDAIRPDSTMCRSFRACNSSKCIYYSSYKLYASIIFTAVNISVKKNRKTDGDTFVCSYFSKYKITHVCQHVFQLYRVLQVYTMSMGRRKKRSVMLQMKFHQPIFQLFLLISTRMELRIYWLFDYTGTRAARVYALHFVHQIYFHCSNELLMQVRKRSNYIDGVKH